MSGRKQQRVPLDLFLSGALVGSIGENDHPVIVVDESKRRSFPGHRLSDNTYRSNHSNSSFCSSVTSCSLDSQAAATAGAGGPSSLDICASVSRWDSMPSSRNQDKKLRAPRRGDNYLKRPSRTSTNDLKKALANKKQQKPTVPKRNSFRIAPSTAAIRRHKSMRCDSMRSKERVTKLHASI